jgi:hypothetical protein
MFLFLDGELSLFSQKFFQGLVSSALLSDEARESEGGVSLGVFSGGIVDLLLIRENMDEIYFSNINLDRSRILRVDDFVGNSTFSGNVQVNQSALIVVSTVFVGIVLAH